MATTSPTTYQELLRLELRHNYFLNGQLPDLAVVPTRATAERLRRAGLLLRQQPSGFVLLALGGYPLAPAFQQVLATRVFPLGFALRPRTQAFHLYTELPEQLADSSPTYCFGLSEAVADSTAANLSLTTGPEPVFIPVPGPKPLGLRPLVFDYYRPQKLAPSGPSAFAPTGKAELWANGEQLAVWPLDGPSPLTRPLTISATIATVDVRKWGSGRYQLRLEGDTLDFYADDDLYAARVWGLLEVDVKALAGPQARRYVLQFTARRVFWQYQFQVLAPKEGRPVPLKLEVREAKKNVKDPTEFEEVHAASSATRIIFRSKNTISLNERYEARQYELFTLHSGLRETEPQWRKLHSALPHADIQQLKTEKEGPVAEIFVSIRI